MTDFVILHNPSSRSGHQVAQTVAPLLASLAETSELSWVSLGDIDRAPFPSKRLVVIGGDGTVNQAATWLHEHGLDRPLAIIPAGTGNNLARGLGVPLTTRSACSLAFEGTRLRSLDAVLYRARGDHKTRVMIQVAALGFPAEIAARYDRLRQNVLLRTFFRPLGPHVYRLLALLGLAAQGRRVRRGEGQLHMRAKIGTAASFTETVFAVFLGNEKSIGGNFHPCPRARPDDGLLDICMIRAGTGERYLKVLDSVAKGRHLQLEKTVLYHQSAGPVELFLSEPSRMLVDGDLVAASDHFQFEILPRHFRVVADSDSGAFSTDVYTV